MNLPNKLSMIRVLIIPVMVVLYYINFKVSGYQLWEMVIPVLFILASFTDFLDGYIARKYNLVTTFGKFIDPLADKLLVMAALLILNAEGVIPMWVTVVILSREFIVTGIRLVAAPTGKVIAASKLGKYKTASTMIALIILLFVPFFDVLLSVGLVVLYVGVLLTVISGIEYFNKNKLIIMDSI
ncbi:CDP-diacylglycerol--glycerol-3-phosphate 3-phosphatidyltransferase [Candidatus Izimaplasma bacterium ZiA1]|uniref:CDP-diacylglycerol--glycerol-3-phosphate 3-phosphatidyltransferase n=1 Tax=Candidatus Izimoplasma sp. ZiA1 TaxID=2024899 RepID=UPI000BAA5CB9|nr:CDP-diacylglycerol--glycerol-3-phosphate 3-phosphatidyltransferase [Candidatus Izimaplasma bacterium ZiA1]